MYPVIGNIEVYFSRNCCRYAHVSLRILATACLYFNSIRKGRYSAKTYSCNFNLDFTAILWAVLLGPSHTANFPG